MITIEIPDNVLAWAKRVAPLMDAENNGEKTKDGGEFKDVKGCLGQWAVNEYLNDVGWQHTYSPPYVAKQYGDSFDISFPSGDIWDVKCRSWLDDIKKYGTLLMGSHEKTGKICDYYIFCTVDREWKDIYILGGKAYRDTWKEIIPLSEQAQAKMRYQTEGKVKVSSLRSLMSVYMHC